MLSIFVIAILAISFAIPFISVMAVLGTPTVDDTAVQVGDVITVTGDPDNVTSGATVEVYWDIVVGADALLLNTTTGDNDGSYEVEITVPETPAGNHYVWVKDTGTGDNMKSEAITVAPELDVDPESGLAGDTVTLTGTGFDAEAGYNVSIFNMTSRLNNVSIAIIEENEEETDEYGSFEIEVDVPDTLTDYGDYWFNVTSAAAGATYNVTVAFEIGASITLTPDEGPEGAVVTIEGRGFEDVILNETDITFFLWPGVQIVDDTIEIDDGEFSGEVIVPSYGEGDWNFTVMDGTNVATDDFTIDGESAVEVDPTYGPPGLEVSVSGYNFTQIAGTEIILDLNGTSLGEAETEADGTWTTTFTVPAVGFDYYVVNATSEGGVNASDAFKVGIIAIIISPLTGPTGTEVTLTGTGFAAGTYNATLGDETVIELGAVSGGETLSDTFFVPSVDPGTYVVAVEDGADNVKSTTFTVTETTSLTPTPSSAAIGYNVSFYGEHFAEQNETTLVWYVYNSTDTLNITAVRGVNYTDTAINIMVSGDGNFTGIWTASDWMLLGNTYTVNVTDAEGLYAETTITIVEEEVEIGPNKASYSLGDTITFTIKATFIKDMSYLEITDPNEELIFLSTFDDGAGDWTEVDDWQVVRIPDQVNDVGMNPFMIPSDGTMGTWIWTLYDADDDVIQNGTIEVLATSAAQVDTRLSSVEDSLTDLSTDLGDLTGDLDDVQTDITSVMSDISDMQADLDNVKTDIISDLSDDIAAATSAANSASDAVGDLEDTVSDIADMANSAKTSADAAAAAATSAASAADEASTAANGLTGLVYGAIGASLIAALAAIFAVMQISRRIAG